MDQIKLHSHAKINLTLEVSAKRSDGYHDIDSVVQIVGISDELVMSKARDGVIEVGVDSGDAPAGRSNLVYRACQAFFVATGVGGGVECVLSKHIPAQAGLGGGSGNAAAAIVGLDRLYETRLPKHELVAIGAGVGSDVPLFVYGGTVRMQGRGERVQPLPDAPELYLVVVKPSVGVSTAWAYELLDRSRRGCKRGTSEQAESAIARGDREALLAALCNDFDPVVSESVSEVAAVKGLLVDLGARQAMLCGSGSAVFGVFDSEAAANEAAGRIRDESLQVFATRGLTRPESISFREGEAPAEPGL